MVLLVFWHIYSPCTRRVFLKPRSVYPWGFTYTFLKVWKPSGITGKYYLSIYTNGMLILLKMDAWSGSYGWFPYNGGLLPEFSFHIQRASLKGQHLTFDVCWQAHLTSIWLRLKGWELPGDDKGRAIRFRPLVPLWLHLLQLSPWPHRPPYSRYVPFRAFLLTIPSAQVFPLDICMNNPLISFRSLLKWIKFLSLVSKHNLPLASPPSISLSPLPLVSPHTVILTYSVCCSLSGLPR